jgi:hypothetical protein
VSRRRRSPLWAINDAVVWVIAVAILIAFALAAGRALITLVTR